MPKLHIYKNEKETCQAFAEWLAELISETLKSKDKFTIALPADDLPQQLYKMLADEYVQKIDWKKVHLFKANDLITTVVGKEASLGEPLDIFIEQGLVPKEQIHLIQLNNSVEEAAREYNNFLHQYFNTESTFDLVIIDMADDGSFLSYFPDNDNNPLISDWVITTENKEKSSYYITLTPAAINAAITKVFLVTGKKKEDAVQQVLKGKYNTQRFPAQAIQSTNKNLHWFLDEGAAGKLVKLAP
jgi:6-phosphogluconolactonase